MNKQEQLPRCLLCSRTMEMNEIFIGHIKKDMESVTHFQCMECAKDFPDDKPDKNGGVWIVCKNTLDGVILLDKDESKR